MAKGFPRTQRVGEEIHHCLSALIREEVKDPRVGMVTVSAVDVSPDLSHAKVFVTVLGSRAEVESSLEGLRHCAGFLRSQLARRLAMRGVPELRFCFDDSVERGARVSHLIDEALRGGRDGDER